MRRSMEQPYLPRSSLPRCSRVIFTFSASSSCVIPLILLSSFRRFPNASWSKYMSCPFPSVCRERTSIHRTKQSRSSRIHRGSGRESAVELTFSAFYKNNIRLCHRYDPHEEAADRTAHLACFHILSFPSGKLQLSQNIRRRRIVSGITGITAHQPPSSQQVTENSSNRSRIFHRFSLVVHADMTVSPRST